MRILFFFFGGSSATCHTNKGPLAVRASHKLIRTCTEGVAHIGLLGLPQVSASVSPNGPWETYSEVTRELS